MKHFSVFSKKHLFYLVICFFVFFQENIIAQDNFVEAKIITLNNDTLQGYIDYQNWSFNPRNIKFKENLTQQKAIRYTVKDIAEFYVDGEVYIRRIAEVDKSPYIVAQLKANAKPLIVVDTFFAQRLVKGTLSLYYLHDDQPKDHFFIEMPDKTFRELTKRTELIEAIDGIDGIRENKAFQKQLAFAMSDCPTVKINFNTLSYTQRSLIKAFEKYNNCKAETSDYQTKKTRRVRWHFGTTAGLSLTDMKFYAIDNIPNFVDLANTNFKKTPNIALALRLDAVFPRSRQRWRIVNELMLRTHSSKGEFNIVENSQTYRNGNVKITSAFLGINTILRYQMPLPNIQPFINIGIGNSFAMNMQNQKDVNRYYWGIESQEIKAAIESTRSYEQARILGFGVAKNKINAEIRFIIGSGIENHLLLNESNRSWNFLFSYMF